jgi:diguanylate cyclase (GGDEF)-like protein
MDQQNWAIGFTIPSVIATLFGLQMGFGTEEAWLFLMVATLFTLASFIVVNRFRNHRQNTAVFDTADLGTWESLHTMLMAGLGLLWAVPSWIAPASSSVPPIVFTVFAAAVALGLSAHRKKAYFAFLFALLSLSAVGVSDNNDQLRLVPVSLLFGMVMALMAAMIADAFSESFLLRHQQERLNRVLLDTNELLEHEANHDQLTGLANRALIVKQLDRFVQRAEYSGSIVGVIFIDLDRFKVINDSLGHDVGDHVLIEVARRVQQALRPGDMVGRLSGDEFVGILPDIPSAKSAVDVSNRVLRMLEAPINVKDRQIQLGACIGVTMSSSLLPGLPAPSSNRSAELIRQADAAMYRAKVAGRNRVEMFDEALGRSVAQREAQERDLKMALSKNQIEAWYQPVVELSTGKVRAVEALARWNHPQRGLLEASEFLQTIEESILVDEFAEAMMRQVCETRTHWEDTAVLPTGLRVSVNVAKPHLARASGLDYLMRAVLDANAEPGWFSVEFKEDAISTNAPVAIFQLEKLRRMGFSIELDDFGSGQSSMSLFKQVPLTGVKLDPSLVSGLGESGSAGSLVRSIVMTATEFGFQVTAEGVESEKQKLTLEALGCSSGQGYYLAHPMREQELLAFIEARVLIMGR